MQSVRDCLPLTATNKPYFGEANEQEFSEKTAYDHVKQAKKENFTFLNEKYAQQGQTVLFGDSITEIFNSYELFYAFSQATGQAVYNRGISGDTSDRCWKGSNVTP